MTSGRIVAAIALIVFFGLTIHVAVSFRTRGDNPAIQRLASRALLRSYAAALEAYRASQGAWPTDLRTLWAWPRFSAESGLAVSRVQRAAALGHRVEGAGFYTYQRPDSDDPATIVVASPLAHRAVAAGEPFGAEGETASAPVAATHYALDAGLNVVELDVDEQERRAPWVTTGGER